MNGLEDKYRNDSLTTEEFMEFKDMINKEPLSAKEERLSHAWMSQDYEMTETGDILTSTKRRIDSALKGKDGRRFKWSGILGIAASAAIIIMGIGLYKVKENNTRMEQMEVKFETKGGEYVSITLPDGTCVELDEYSMISYKIANFGKSERNIEFKGDGYFSVAKNQEKPFIVSSEFIKVTVTGTEFFFTSHPDDKQVGIILDEGSVTMKSNINGYTCNMVAGQKAKLDFPSGYIIISEKKTDGRKVFRNNSLDFINTPLGQVLDRISSECGLDITVKSLPERSSFSGHLSITKPNESLNLLAKIYDLNIIFANGTVIISQN